MCFFDGPSLLVDKQLRERFPIPSGMPPADVAKAVRKRHKFMQEGWNPAIDGHRTLNRFESLLFVVGKVAN